MNCPTCGHKMEHWSEPTLDSTAWSYWLCPHCGTEIGIDEGAQ